MPCFQIHFPSSTHVVLGPSLSHIKVIASESDQDNTEGLCGNFDGNRDNEFPGSNCRHKSSSECATEAVRTQWM